MLHLTSWGKIRPFFVRLTMKKNKVAFSLCLAYLLASLLTFMPNIPHMAQADIYESYGRWQNRYSYQIDSVMTFYNAPQVFWNGSDWQELNFEDHYITDGYYLLQNAHITAQIYEWYSVFYDPDNQKVSVDDERLVVEVYNEKTSKWRYVDLYNPTLSYSNNATHLTVTRTFDCPEGLFNITYIVWQGSFLKHEIVFQSRMTGTNEFNVHPKLSGIHHDKVRHKDGTETITTEKHIITPYFLIGESDSNLVLSEYLWSLGSFNETTGEWESDTLKDVVFNTHAKGCKVDIVIGNYTLAENESLVIDPTTSTFYSSSSDGHIFATSDVPKFGYMIAQSAASGYVSDSLDFIRIGQNYDILLEYWSVVRGFMFFDTSALDDDLEISSAKLGLYGHTDGSDADFNIVIQNGQPTYPHDPLETTDYNKNNYDGNGGEFATSGFSTSQYNNITLNDDGISWINKEGTTKLCLRSSEDIAVSAPTGSEQVWVWASEGDYQPFLEVTWEEEEEEEIDCNWIGINNTIAGQPTKFSIDWTDLNASDGLSHNLFSTNNTGAWANDTWTDTWYNGNWTETVKTLNSTSGLVVAFISYVNDTNGVEHASTFCFFTTATATNGTATFDLVGYFINQTAVSGANVSLTDSGSVEIFHVQTDGSGKIPTQYAPYGSDPHTLKVFKKGIRMYQSVFNTENGTINLILTLTARGWVLGTKGITFEPNVIPELKISYVEEFFRFKWKDNRFDLKLLIAYNDTKGMKMLSLRDFWEKTDGLVKWREVCDKATDSMYEFGYMIEDIPEEIADNVEYLVWKIEGASFDVSQIELEEGNRVTGLSYNITWIHLPSNLVLSYEDLWLYGFTISHPNKLEAKIEGVKGKTSWNLDPITYSIPTITVVGFNETDPCTFQDVCDVNDENGWGVVDAIGKNQFIFSAQLCLGDVNTLTWFNDTFAQVFFDLSEIGVETFAIDMQPKSYLTLGELLDSEEKITSGGVSMILGNMTNIISTSDYCGLYLYGSYFASTYEWSYMKLTTANGAFFYGTNITLYNVVLSSIDALMLEYYVQVDIHNLQMIDTYCFYIKHVMAELAPLSGIEIIGAEYFVWISTQDEPLTITDLYGRNANISSFFFAWLNNNLYLIDCDLDAWTFDFYESFPSSGEVFRQYSFDLTFTFEDGSYAEGTNVTISNEYLGTSESWILSSNGSIPTQTYSMGYYNETGGDVPYDYNPYNITATLDGYQTYTTLINITQKEDLTIALQASEEADEMDTVRSVFLLFIPCILFSLLYEYRNNQSVKGNLDLRWAGVVASGFWLALSIAWFVLATTTFVVGLLWNGIGILYIVRVMISLIRMKSLDRRLGDEAF